MKLKEDRKMIKNILVLSCSHRKGENSGLLFGEFIKEAKEEQDIARKKSMHMG